LFIFFEKKQRTIHARKLTEFDQMPKIEETDSFAQNSSLATRLPEIVGHEDGFGYSVTLPRKRREI
jgi:hypothetical protein